MALTARRLALATLARQLLLARQPLGPVDAVGRLLALQAQEPASPYVALANRVDGFDPAHLDAAFDGRAVVKASLLRITLHAVRAEDHRDVHAAMVGTLRAARLHDRRFTSTGLVAADVDALLPDLLAFAATPRSGDEMRAWLADRLGRAPDDEGTKRALWALRHYAPLLHAPNSGPWRFARTARFEASGTAGGGEPGDEDTGLRVLVRRYLEAFGPAGVGDVAQFTMLSRPRLRRVLASMAAELVQLEGPDGAALVDVPEGALPGEDVQAPPRLLGMWDQVLLAYADRSRVVPDDLRPLVLRRNGDALPTVLVDGGVVGVWRVVEGRVEARVWRDVSARTWDGLAAEAAGLQALVTDRDPGLYARYAHWWASLPPPTAVRLLP